MSEHRYEPVLRPLMTAAAAGDVDGVNMERHRLMGRPLPWTCTACDTPCDLVLNDATFKFRSMCCDAAVEPTKTRLQDADTP